MRDKEVQFKVRIAPRDMGAFLDMLRYEADQVVTWERMGEVYLVTLVTKSTLFQPDRWASFMLFPTEVTRA